MYLSLVLFILVCLLLSVYYPVQVESPLPHQAACFSLQIVLALGAVTEFALQRQKR